MDNLIAALAKLERLADCWTANLTGFTVDLSLMPYLVCFGRSHLAGSKPKETILIVYDLYGAYSLFLFILYFA